MLKHDVIKTYGRVELKLHAFITSAPDGDKWSASQSSLFSEEGKTPGIHQTGDEWATAPVWTWWFRGKYLPLPRIEPLSSNSQSVTLVTKLSRLVNKV